MNERLPTVILIELSDGKVINGFLHHVSDGIALYQQEQEGATAFVTQTRNAELQARMDQNTRNAVALVQKAMDQLFLDRNYPVIYE